MLLESIAPRRASNSIPFFRWLNNFVLTALNQAILFVWQPFASLYLVEFTGLNTLTLVGEERMSLPLWVLTLVITIEFFTYWQHRMFHQIPILWRIHSVHHSDTQVDASTAHRHHPLEPMLGVFFLIPVFLVFEPPTEALVLVAVFHSLMAAITHANLSLGKAFTSLLRPIIVTPDYHRVHHMADVTHTNSNYANCLPVFDLIFSTRKDWTEDEQRTHALGLEYLQPKNCSGLSTMLTLPFE